MQTIYPFSPPIVVKASILRPIKLTCGNNCRLHDLVVLGEGEHREYYAHPEKFKTYHIQIGNDTVIREFTTLHRGVVCRDTKIGDRCFIMSHCHLAHDVVLEDDVTLADGTTLGGVVTIMRHANMGLNSTVHQNVVIGSYAMIGCGSIVTHHVPPYTTFYSGRVHGLNIIGMERSGFKRHQIQQVFDYYAKQLNGEEPKLTMIDMEVRKEFHRFIRAKRAHPNIHSRPDSKWDWPDMTAKLMAEADK